MTDNPFQPSPGSGQTLTTGAASASVAINAADKSLLVTNGGATNPAYIRMSVGASTAVTSDMVLMPGKSVLLFKGSTIDTFSHLQLTGSTTLYIITGNGGFQGPD